MSNYDEVSVYVFQLSDEFPVVYKVQLNDEVIGYISDNRDWNKKEKPVSLLSSDGIHICDFCCIGHAASHITHKKTGIEFYDVDVMTNVETRVFKVDPSSDWLDALMYALSTEMAGKRPH